MSLAERFDAFLRDWLPDIAMRREAARAALKSNERLASSFRDAYNSRIDRPVSTGGRADYHLELTADRRAQVVRARDLERNSALAAGMLARSTENVVGQGFDLRARTEDEDWNNAAERLWDDWTNEADVRGLSTLHELMALHFRGYLRDGDSAFLLLADGLVQAIESDQISSPSGQLASRSMVDGIQLDSRGRPVSFWVVQEPDPTWTSVLYQKHAEIPAESVVFDARRERQGQTRGISALNGSAWLFDQIDGNIEAVTVAARMAASFGVLITKNQPMSGLATAADSAGINRKKLGLEPGMWQELRPGEGVVQVKAEQPTTQFPDFLNTLVKLVGIPFGLPVELFYDFANANYSNHKAAMLQAQRVWCGHQGMLGRTYSKLYRWKIAEWTAQRRLRPRPDQWAHDWVMPGWKWLDPVKEAQAAIAAIDAGFDTPSSVVSRQGMDFESLLMQRRKDFAALSEALPPIRGTLTRDPVAPKPEPESTSEPDESEAEEESASES